MTKIYGVVVATVVAMAAIPSAAHALDLTVGAGPVQNCPDAEYGVALSAAAIAYLEPAPVVTVNDYGGGQYSPSPGNNRGIGMGFAELAAKVAGLCIGAIYRAEYRAEASRDLLDALVANHVGHPFDPNRTYRLSLTEESFKAYGMRMRRITNIDFSDQWSTKLGLGVSLLKATQGQRESVSGEVTSTSSTYAVGTATWLNTKSNLNLANFNPFVAAGSPAGTGFSSDVEFSAKSTNGVAIDLIVVDAFGRIYWRDVPQSFKSFNNSTISYNANFDRDAFVNGVDSRVRFVQALAPKNQLSFSLPVTSKWSALVEDGFVNGLHFPSIGAQYGMDGKRTEVNYDIRTRAVTLGGTWKALKVSVTSNDVRLGNASVLGLSVQGTHSW